MSARPADRRHARSVELAMEIRASQLREREYDEHADRRAGICWRFLAAIRAQVVELVPATSRLFVFVERGLNAMRGFVHFDRKRDHENDVQEALTLELAGLLDGVVDEPAAVSA